MFLVPITNSYAAITGSGSEMDPYLIGSVEDLQDFAADSATYWAAGVYTQLTTDIDLTGQTYSTAVIAPDSNNTNDNFTGMSYSGVFNGAGYKVSNLTIDTNGSGNDFIGFFGQINSGATVKNLGIVDVTIIGGTGTLVISGLCGENWGTIQNCYVTGNVTGVDNVAGGICGIHMEGIIEYCYATGNVAGLNNVGGLCGYSYGTIKVCYATGNVTGMDYVGGLCGRYISTEPMTNCYATGSVTGRNLVGGLCGQHRGYSGPMTNCYATGSVTGNDYVGGLCGDGWGSIGDCYATGSVTGNNYVGGFCGDSGGIIENCFWDVTTSGIGNEGDDNFGAIGKTTIQMKDSNTFTDAGWDFTNTWEQPNGSYPILQWQNQADNTNPSIVPLIQLLLF
jgi:hypothetical protein